MALLILFLLHLLIRHMTTRFPACKTHVFSSQLSCPLQKLKERVFRRRRSGNAEFKTLNLSVRLSTSRHNLIPRLHLQREQTINARRLLSLMPKTNRFLHSLELDKLLGDGPELLGMVRVQRIGQIAGEG
jgi:hypothetical protein